MTPFRTEAGVARLVGTEASSFVSAAEQLVDDPREYHRAAEVTNPYGIGKSSELIVRAIVRWWNPGKDKDQVNLQTLLRPPTIVGKIKRIKKSETRNTKEEGIHPWTL